MSALSTSATDNPETPSLTPGQESLAAAMSVQPVTGSTEARKPVVALIPWDPRSPAHVDRLYNQRVACGWNQELVRSSWAALQREGGKGLHWIVIDPTTSSPFLIQQQLARHHSAYPLESDTLTDTASFILNSARSPKGTHFHPIGHISLDPPAPDTPSPAKRTKNSLTLLPPTLDLVTNLDLSRPLTVNTFYISMALQSLGFGAAAMRAVENFAREIPYSFPPAPSSAPPSLRQLPETRSTPATGATVVILDTLARESHYGDADRWAAYGRESGPPSVPNQDWYERRGYITFERDLDGIKSRDRHGKLWVLGKVWMVKGLLLV